MSRARGQFRVLALAMTAVVVASACRTARAEGHAAQMPNVLILLADDLGWNGVGFHSRTATTPNLDRFAKDGLELQRFYSYPVCSPARAALLSGRMPRRFGLADVIGPQQEGLPKGGLTLPSLFRSAGYQTSLIGKWHLGGINPPLRCGFDHFYGFMGPEVDYFKHTGQRGTIDWQRDGKTVDEQGYSTYLFADEAIRQLKGRDANRPFYMQVAFNAPHVPIAAPEDLVVKHKGDGLYAAVIEGMDIAIGRILGEIDAQGLRDNTLVLFYSDNGATRRDSSNAPLSYGKGTVYEGGIRTPCVIRWPGKVPAGGVTQQPVSGQDWLPTLAAAAGLTIPADADLDGSNQWPALSSGKLVDRKPFLIAAYDIALIDGDWKLIEWADGAYSLINLQNDISEKVDEFIRQPQVARRMQATLIEQKKGLPDVSARRGPGGPRGAGGGPPGRSRTPGSTGGNGSTAGNGSTGGNQPPRQ
ncbi:sulfatase-like hydrolase/transferase [Humisphaera borealis]|uniref:Sulfatase-like hydrolase/transferase n=1 Tax=Humisphaera borealis TaxID=2807512 RepID=A0A7M2X3A0_9BACT|nr:sulfatase-like hydrolase/transferase [Humisphaera borealis]QOV91240.1 sulfatase-like hydrolase/transferase [Humisphaera borealis]